MPGSVKQDALGDQEGLPQLCTQAQSYWQSLHTRIKEISKKNSKNRKELDVEQPVLSLGQLIEKPLGLPLGQPIGLLEDSRLFQDNWLLQDSWFISGQPVWPLY